MSKNTIFIPKDRHALDLEKTFECGQCFRWTRTGEDEYSAVVKGRAVKAKETPDGVEFVSDNEEGLEEFINDYFALDTDYSEIDRLINTDSHLEECIKYGNGIRILRQEPFETMISFIISQNNNIPRIKAITEKLCEAFGKEITFEDETYRAFPTPEELRDVSREEYRALGMGFRDKYVLGAVKMVLSGELDFEKIAELDTEKAREELMKVKGIGRKVADCILLFAFNRLEICPVDTWMKKIFVKYYDVDQKHVEEAFGLSREKWGKYAGIAQQYLFYYERENA